MLITSVTNIFESIINSEFKNYVGNIENPKEFLTDENLNKLDEAIQGVFCFISFHPRHDEALFDYVCSNTFASDTGKHILALFTVEESALTPLTLDKKLFESWLTVEDSNYPAYEIVNELFQSEKPPHFPGILVVERLAESSEPVYVPLDKELKGTSLESTMRELFLIVDEAYRHSGSATVPFAANLGTLLAKRNIPYMRISTLSTSEWLYKSIAYLRKRGGDIATIVKFVGGITSSLGTKPTGKS